MSTDTLLSGSLWFSFMGTLSTTGLQNVTLFAHGNIPAATPLGPQTFTVKLGTSSCTFVVDIAPPANGTVDCTGATVNGSYGVGIALTASETVQISVDVTTIGAYTITTDTMSGIWFNASGNFATTGVTPLTLIGHGTPTGSGGPTTFTVKFGTSTCTFSVTIAGPAVYTIDCPNVVVNGTYQAGVALDASNTIDIPITVTTAGPWGITASIDGMTFQGSGTLTLASTSITLIGSGTPTSSAGSPYNLSVGSPACTIPITVIPGATIDWKFTIVGGGTYQGSTDPGGVVFDPSSAPPITDFEYSGGNAAFDDITFQFLDLTGGINGGETYNTNSTGSTNIAFFYFTDGPGTIDLAADFSTAGVNIVFTVTSHNVATKTITGTFLGTAHDFVSGTDKTITNGTFTAVYP